MATANTILAILGFVSSVYGLALFAAWTTPSFSGLRMLAPRSWNGGAGPAANRNFVMARAGYMTSFGLFIGCQAIGQPLLAIIFAVPAIIFAGIVVGQWLRSRRAGTDA